MALVKIPLSPEPDVQFAILLDGTVYTLRTTLNDRSGRFKLDVMTETLEEIVGGVQLVANWPLLRRFKDERLPLGDLFLWDSTGRNREPTEDTIRDGEMLLLYQEAS